MPLCHGDETLKCRNSAQFLFGLFGKSYEKTLWYIFYQRYFGLNAQSKIQIWNRFYSWWFYLESDRYLIIY